MKFSYNWLRELVPFPWSVPELAERLTMAGVEVEEIFIQGEGLSNVVAAQILKSEQHPNADRLSVCEVDCGSGKKNIVCGAKNYKVGDKIPLALPGATLPNGMEIRRSKLRGVESDGMMCSSKELGLAEDAEGLLILPPETKPGQPIAEALGLNDTLFELEITPNRSDLLSHWGMAREIAAIGDFPSPSLTQLLPENEERMLRQGTPPHFPITVEDSQLCPRYTARLIRGVKVGPSPEWLRRRLESLGERTISNVVDLTNYVLHEMGQPLHAFDLGLLQGPAILVRRARASEKIVRLDDETSELNPNILVIADAQGPVAIAGVMGGRHTGVNDSTTDILLESAMFQPGNIRKTSKALGVSSGSSYRFERGVDAELAAWASFRATQLIVKVCGGKVEGGLMDCRSSKPIAPSILCRHARVQSILGKTVPAAEASGILKRLGCELNAEGEVYEVRPPSYRPDLMREIDLIEEIARVYGIQNIPGTVSPIAVTTTKTSGSFLFTQNVRSILSKLGLNEAANYSIVSGETVKELSGGDGVPVPLANPLNTEMDTLRPSLWRGLIEAATRNFSGGNAGVALFEVGKVFSLIHGNAQESPSIALILAGARFEGATWEKQSARSYDFYDLKGVVTAFLESLGVSHVRTEILQDDRMIPVEKGLSLELLSPQGTRIGIVGTVKSSLARAAKVPLDLFFAELNAAWLQEQQPGLRPYQPWPVYPSIRRDIALTLGAGQKHRGIEEMLQKLAKTHAEPRGIFLQKVELFDIFASDKIGNDRKSLAYLMIYQSPSKTLTDPEVNQVHDAIKKELREQISCEIRE